MRPDSVHGQIPYTELLLTEDGALVPLQLREVPYMVSDRVQNLGAYFVGLNYDYIYVDITN